MILTFIFLFFLLLENLLLPALIGPGPFFISLIFIIGTLIYEPSWKKALFFSFLFLFAKGLYEGTELLGSILPFAITAIINLWMNRFINFSDQLRENISPAGILVGTILLVLFSYIYSWFFLLLSSSYDIGQAWQGMRMFFVGSLVGMLGWSAAISILFKFVLYRK